MNDSDTEVRKVVVSQLKHLPIYALIAASSSYLLTIVNNKSRIVNEIVAGLLGGITNQK
jgi:hypothetical protein